MKYCIKKLQKKDVKNQLKENHYYDFLTLVSRREKMTLEAINNFMYSFMT